MAALDLISWNVNGARAVEKKGFLDWLHRRSPDVVCLQETRAELSQLSAEMAEPDGYHGWWNPSRARKGYSGTAILTRQKPLEVEMGLGVEEFDVEGRTTIAHFEGWSLINSYFPNGRRDHSRVPYKLEFCEAFLERCNELRKAGQRIVFCGDLNTSHQEIDLARPKANRNTTGFLEIERAWIDRVLEADYVDCFRERNPELEGAYSWWAMRMKARERNVGWRLDYFFVDRDSDSQVSGAEILSDIHGSDHCPVQITFEMGDQ